MRLLLAWCAVPLVSAFYLYIDPEGDGTAARPHKRSPAPRASHAGAGIRLPLARVQRKRENEYTIVPSAPPDFPHSTAVDQDGTDYSYVVSLTLGGAAGAPFYMLLDTAAPSTWVMGSGCRDAACDLHDTFGPEDADVDALTVTAERFGVAYGSGRVSGVLCRTPATLAGLTAPLTLGLATAVSDEFASFPMDGILGLGLPGAVGDDPTDPEGAAPLPDTTPSLLDVLVARGLVPRALFAVQLSRAADGRADGELSLGAANPARHAGALSWFAAVPSARGFWELPLAAAAVGGVPTPFAPLAGAADRTAILDTGTSFLLAPHGDAVALHAGVPGAARLDAERWSVPCDAATPMALAFGVDGEATGRWWRIRAADYVGPELEADPGRCASNVVGRTTFGPRQWLVGDVFLKNVYAVFDKEGARVAFGVPSDEEEDASGGGGGGDDGGDEDGGGGGQGGGGGGSGGPGGHAPHVQPDSHAHSNVTRTTTAGTGGFAATRTGVSRTGTATASESGGAAAVAGSSIGWAMAGIFGIGLL